MSIKTNRLTLFSLLSLIFASFFMSNVNGCMNGGNMPDPSLSGGGGGESGFIILVSPTETSLTINQEDGLWIFADLEVSADLGVMRVETTATVPSNNIPETIMTYIPPTEAGQTYAYLRHYEIQLFFPAEDTYTLLFSVFLGAGGDVTLTHTITISFTSGQTTCDLLNDLKDYLNNNIAIEEWKNPNNLKAMNNKLNACLDLCNTNQLTELNDKLVNDILPKLTGEKISGKEFKGAWISDSDTQDDLENILNNILNSI
jgi:hypothetical protein